MDCGLPAADASNVGTTATLRGVSLLPDGGWAVGDSQTLLQYKEGSWAKKTSPNGTDSYWLKSIAVFDAENAWAVGGWALSSSSYRYGLALRLSAGTWFIKQDSLGWALNDVDLADANNGWAVGSKGQLTRITGGAYSPLLNSPVTADLFGVDIIDAQTGWAVGANGNILKLSSGTWSLASAHPTYNLLSDVVLTDAQNGWAVGNNGTVLRLQSNVWSVEQAITNRNLTAVAMAPDGTVWAVGELETILRYAGGHWEQCHYGATGAPALYSVAAAGPHVWAVGAGAYRRPLR